MDGVSYDGNSLINCQVRGGPSDVQAKEIVKCLIHIFVKDLKLRLGQNTAGLGILKVHKSASRLLANEVAVTGVYISSSKFLAKNKTLVYAAGCRRNEETEFRQRKIKSGLLLP